MTVERLPMTKFGKAALVVLMCSGMAQAQTPKTLTLDFSPPDMAVRPICQARAADADLIATWGNWDGKTLPDRDPGLITRELRRLDEIDAVKWDPTIQAAILALHKASPKFTDDDVTLAQINQMIATGQLKALNESGLVQKLLDRGDQATSRMQYALSGWLIEGTGIAKDPARGTALLMAAGYGGNADALLALSRMSVMGQAPAGWDIAPDLAVTMAFGALVGQMDPLICDRIARIAREYTAGTVVTVNNALAMRWYRFAADLGDPVSAWRVVEYQLQSELITKDNDVLLTYLRKAVDGGLPYAMVTLGRILEAGALVPQDVPAAKALYEKAAAMGDHAALIRLSGFLEARLPTDPSLRPAYLDNLKHLAALPDAPGWAFAKQAALIIEDEGRWKGEAEALPLWQEGARRQDPTAIRALAEVSLGRARTAAQFYAAVDPLIQMVSNLNEVAPATDVKEAFLCKAPDAPHLREAAYWTQVETSIGSTAKDFTPQMLAELASKSDPLSMAVLQTQALAGRATPLADMLAVLKDKHASDSASAFWVNYASQYPGVTTATATLNLARAKTPSQRAQAMDLFRKAIALGDDDAALKLATALLQEPDLANRTEALALLEPLAEKGRGTAMNLLQVADPARYPNPAVVFAKYAPAIAARGDFNALLLAMPYLTDPVERELYRSRATEVMGCSFFETIAFANLWGSLGQTAEAQRWLSIAAELTGDDEWQMVGQCGGAV
jgi:TPR repeat protein